MPNFLCNRPTSLDEIRTYISNVLTQTYAKQPAHIVFLCGDAHPAGGIGPDLDLCNQIARWILDDGFLPYCSKRLCRQVALHLECGTDREEVNKIIQKSNIENLRELGLIDSNILGWEPSGFADFVPISELMSKQQMTQNDKLKASRLLTSSNAYFRSLHEDWTIPITDSLVDLGATLESPLDQRQNALDLYMLALLRQRIEANMALANSMNRSISEKVQLFVHFVSVGNAHIVEGTTIIEGITFTGYPHVVGFSVGRLV